MHIKYDTFTNRTTNLMMKVLSHPVQVKRKFRVNDKEKSLIENGGRTWKWLEYSNISFGTFLMTELFLDLRPSSNVKLFK